MKTILAADIGGTNSRFTWFQSDPDANLSLKESIWLPIGSGESFAQLLGQLQDSRYTMPVFLMADQNSGLWGAAFYGQQLLRKG